MKVYKIKKSWYKDIFKMYDDIAKDLKLKIDVCHVHVSSEDEKIFHNAVGELCKKEHGNKKSLPMTWLMYGPSSRYADTVKPGTIEVDIAGLIKDNK